MNCIDTVLATVRPWLLSRYHHKSATNTKARPNHSRLQCTASFMVTLCAPWRSITNRSMAMATTTKTASAVHIHHVPIVSMIVALYRKRKLKMGEYKTEDTI